MQLLPPYGVRLLMNPFDAFPEAIITCEFLQLAQGGARGNSIIATTSFGGILKERKGMSTNQNMELKESTSTLHIRPDEPFLATVQGDMVGHGIRATKNGSTVTYRIVGQPEGYDFNAGINEFFWVTLKKEKLAGAQ